MRKLKASNEFFQGSIYDSQCRNYALDHFNKVSSMYLNKFSDIENGRILVESRNLGTTNNPQIIKNCYKEEAAITIDVDSNEIGTINYSKKIVKCP